MLARCNHEGCTFTVPWDPIGAELMKAHLADHDRQDQRNEAFQKVLDSGAEFDIQVVLNQGGDILLHYLKTKYPGENWVGVYKTRSDW